MENKSYYTISELNCNSLPQRVNEVKNQLIKNDRTILLLNDTRLTTKSKIAIESHEINRSDHQSNTAVAGGTAIAVPKAIAFKSIKSRFEETSTVELDLEGLIIK